MYSSIPKTACDRVYEAIKQYPLWDADVMYSIARAENRTCEMENHNLTSSETHRRADGSVICVGSYGVLQVGCLHYSGDEDINDLTTNIRIAHAVWTKQGYSAWTMYNNGTYREFMP